MSDMIRKAFKMRVLPDQWEEYTRRHNPIWGELEAVLKTHGVSNYSIFLDEDRCTLFAYAEVRSEDLWQAIAETEVCKRWWRYMADLMETNQDYSPVAVPLEVVFHLE